MGMCVFSISLFYSFLKENQDQLRNSIILFMRKNTNYHFDHPKGRVFKDLGEYLFYMKCFNKCFEIMEQIYDRPLLVNTPHMIACVPMFLYQY
jgi:hypothetical protein